MIAKADGKRGSGHVEIESVMAIQKIEFDLRPGSVVELSGPNGTGKSTTIDIVKRAISGEMKGAGLLPHDGSKIGIAHVDGVDLRVQRTTRAVGEAVSYEIIVNEDDLGTLIDPRLKGEEASNKARLRALCKLAGVSISVDQIEAFCGGKFYDSIRSEVAGKGAVDQVEIVKKALELHARECEKSADSVGGQVVELTASLVGFNELDNPGAAVVSDKKAAMDSASEKLVEMRSSLKSANAAREEMKAIVLPDVSLAESILSDANDDLAVAANAKVVIEAEIEELKKALALAVTAHERAVSDVRIAEKDLAGKRENVANYDRCLAAATGGVTEDSVQTALMVYESASQDYAEAFARQSRFDERLAESVRLEDLKVRLLDLEKDAIILRDSAKSAHTLLETAVESVPGWSLNSDLVLCCNHSLRGVIPFADASPGERARMAIVAVCNLRKSSGGRHGLLVIDQEVWDSLDAIAQGIVVETIREMDVCLLTGRCPKLWTCDSCFEQHGAERRVCSCGGSPMVEGLSVNVL